MKNKTKLLRVIKAFGAGCLEQTIETNEYLNDVDSMALEIDIDNAEEVSNYLGKCTTKGAIVGLVLSGVTYTILGMCGYKMEKKK